tara:strand:- start:128919 stop:129377 length:459 start_codon:yes stop_codon:yes gene_type:complete
MSFPTRIFSVGFLVCTTLVPLIFGDMYPFTMFPMYSDNRDFVHIFEIENADGEALVPQDYGLAEIMLAVSDQRYGTHLRPRYFQHYDEITQANIEKFLSRFYPAQAYPIRVKSHRRGYSRIEQCIVDSDWQAFDISLTTTDHSPTTTTRAKL